MNIGKIVLMVFAILLVVGGAVSMAYFDINIGLSLLTLGLIMFVLSKMETQKQQEFKSPIPDVPNTMIPNPGFSLPQQNILPPVPAGPSKEELEAIEAQKLAESSEELKPELEFTDLKAKKKFKTSEYEVIEKGNRNLALAISPDGNKAARFVKK